jgi:uncharacterized protein YbjT (DUF2867 family)
MDTNKTFFITGGTGNQGGSTARNLAENDCRVIALVRDLSSSKTEKLKHPNIEMVKGDLADPLTYKNHLKNIDGAFAMFIYTDGIKKEIENGKSFIDAAKEMEVPFVLYSSVIGADSGSGIPHWESKYQIEEYLKSSKIPYTIIRPASFFENFFIPDVRKRIVKGNLVTPVRKDKTQQFISTDDVGKICAYILRNKEQFIGRTITVAADEMDMQSAANIFSDVLGKQVRYSQLPGLLTRIFMGKDLHTMFNYVNKNNVCFVKDMNAVKTEFPFLTSMRDWIGNNKSSFIS